MQDSPALNPTQLRHERVGEFKRKWGPGGSAHALNERQGAQSYFNDLCTLLGVPQPSSEPGESGQDYLFEKQTLALGQVRGYADVFKRNHFAWENKAPGGNLDAALRQLLGYSLALDNPPILVVCDRVNIRIHTQFNGYPSETFLVTQDKLFESIDLLRRLWTDPGSLRPAKTSRDITELAAQSFAKLAELIRKRGHHPDKVAHFLTQCLFCFFAEDVGLLPGRMFQRLVDNRSINSAQLTVAMENLFKAMQTGGPYGADYIPWFNGGLFQQIDVPKLEILDISELRSAAQLNWSAIDVSIFGTLFERGLDPAKRSQLGAHYTDPATIMRLIEPVVKRPLLLNWEHTKTAIRRHLAENPKTSAKQGRKLAHEAFVQWLEQLKAYRVLDPACGSGNFLFLALKVLKDIEHTSHVQAQALGLDRETDLVTGPHNVHGIELNPYAAELARLTVWIGELQWRMAHGYPFKMEPVLEPLDNIECRDALIRWESAEETALSPSPKQPAPAAPTPKAVEADWPYTSVVIGNPPFLGDKKMRSELGDAYTDALRKAYAGRVPGGADLVCYWFEKARKAIETNGLGAAGLVATQSIRAGANRKVLAAICDTTKIYEAWSDEAWVNEGAAVRVSLVAFGHAAQEPILNGSTVQQIFADLAAALEGEQSIDLSTAQALPQNSGLCFIGTQKGGAFEVSGALARDWLRLPNVNGLSNALVVKPWLNGQDITGRGSDQWIVDFGNDIVETDASLFEAPFTHITGMVKAIRHGNREAASDKYWWLLQRPRPEMRAGLKSLSRYIITPRVAKHRFFIFTPCSTLPDSRLCAITRADDTTFGILSSRIHEAWSLAQASMHGVGNDPTYNAKSCFETFPFPQGLTPLDTAHQRIQAVSAAATAASPATSAAPTTPALIPANLPTPALQAAASSIAQAAQRLDALRQNWLNPPEWTYSVPEVTPLGMAASPYPDRIVPRSHLSEADAKALQKRTLTNLYNARPAWLAAAHAAVDAAVAAAYGWADYTPELPDAEILARLLALNLERSQS